jgi:hypothetical protein
MRNKHPRKEIHKLIDNELNEKEKETLLQHLHHCKKCEREYKSLLCLKNMLSQKERIEPSNYFVSKVMNNLKTAEPSVSFMELIANRAWSLMLVFIFIIFLFLGIFIYSDLTAPAETTYAEATSNESYEKLLIAGNGMAVNGVSNIEASSMDTLQAIIIEE